MICIKCSSWVYTITIPCLGTHSLSKKCSDGTTLKISIQVESKIEKSDCLVSIVVVVPKPKENDSYKGLHIFNATFATKSRIVKI